MSPALALKLVTPSREAFSWDSSVIGKIIEISGDVATARTSATVAWLHAAQAAGELVAWIQPVGGRLYPPDLAASGIDLNALLVVHVPEAAGAYGMPKAAEILLRSGAYGLVILDWSGSTPPNNPAAWQGRLLGLARTHESGVVLLTQKSAQAESLGALVSVRIEPRRQALRAGWFALEAAILKNKSGVSLSSAVIRRRGPAGLY